MLDFLDNRKPKCCIGCGQPMEWYGNIDGIAKWHDTLAAAMSDSAEICVFCRRSELLGMGKTYSDTRVITSGSFYAF